MPRHLCDSEFSWCPPDASAGDFCKLRIKDPSPTQFAVGKSEVAVRCMCKKFNKGPHKLHDYLSVRPIPVVVRGDRFYLVDHHHLVRALYAALHQARGEDICVYVKVMANASTLEEVYFWKSMHEQNCVLPVRPLEWRAAAAGNTASACRGPQVRPLPQPGVDSPGASRLREKQRAFSDFKWANYFRTRILLDQDILAGKHTLDDFAFAVEEHGVLEVTDEGKEILEEAPFLANSPEARGLQGYRGPMS
jgi:hypothetical protein